MVLDATSVAFPQLDALGNSPAVVSIISPAKPAAVSQSLADALARPTKRRRTNQNQLSTPLTTPSPGPSSVSTGIDFDALDAARRRSSARVMSLWESLAARYARPLDEDDEIDILTGKIYKDRGVLRAASERGWRIGSFGEAIEVEPIGGTSEAETETGTSECGEDGEEGDHAGSTEDVEEDDAFGAWSYDWQYRKLPPPRPELSPQDAEDLEHFLEAERAIQEENALKNGGKPALEDDEDDVVYLGDSWHDQDGALLNDGSDDEEFSSFAIDESTIQLSKKEEKEDDVEPVSSILGALALGKTPQKALSIPTCTNGLGSPRTVQTPPLHAYRDGGRVSSSPSNRDVLPHTRLESEAGVEDEVIVIESDSDEEVDDDMKPGSKVLPCAKPPSDVVVLPLSKIPSPKRPTGGSYNTARSNFITPDPKTTVSASSTHVASESLSDTLQQKRSSFFAMVAALQASTIADAHKVHSDPIPAESFYSTLSTSKSTTKPISKRMRSRETANTKKVETPSTSKTKTASSREVVTASKSTFDAASTSVARARLQEDTPKAAPAHPEERKRESTLALPDPKTPRQPARQDSNSTGSKTTGKGHAVITQGSTNSAVLGSPRANPTSLTSSPMTFSSGSTRASPSARCKKSLVMEVVLTPSRRALAAKPQLAKRTTPATLVNSFADTPASGSGPPFESAPTSDTKAAAQTTHVSQEKLSGASDNLGLPNVGSQANRTRKRPRESGEGFKAEEAKLEPGKSVEVTAVEQSRAIDRDQSCHPPIPQASGRGQPSTCYFGCFPSPPSAHTCQHSHSHGTCSHPHMHHCSGVHQHQHQHLHTHLPFPLPQDARQFTANELTEAALKLMYGLGAIRPSDSNTFGHGIWAGSSAQVSPSKFEKESNSHEPTPESQERVPSSQKHESHKEEKEHQRAQRRAQASPVKLALSSAGGQTPCGSTTQVHTITPHPSPPPTGPSLDITSVLPDGCPSPRVPTPKRESSVIDIDSDSDDELAGFNAGEGSIRWVPSIKDEGNSEDDPLYLDGSDDDMLLSSPEGMSKRRLRTRVRGKRQQKSPSKLHRHC